jgi:hypothetical protein
MMPGGPGMGMPGGPGMGMPGMPGGPGMGMPGQGPIRPVFGSEPVPQQGPDFPNAAPPSGEPVSPFSMKADGNPNAFSDLEDPRARRATPYHFTIRGEYLNWQIDNGKISTPLITTTTQPATQVGALGQSGTRVLLPAGEYDYGRLPGQRMTVGLASGILPAFEVTGFSINHNATLFSGGSSNATGILLARPVQLADIPVANGAGTEDVEFINVPGVANGSATVVSRLNLWGVEANLFFPICDTDCLHIDFLAGYRHADLNEVIEINSRLGGNLGNVNFNGQIGLPTGFSTSVTDSFKVRNQFDGGQFGVRGVLNISRFSLFTEAKLALGNTRQNLYIDGYSTMYQPVAGRASTTVKGGLLALPSNIGSTSVSDFSIIPEVNATLSYQLGSHVRLFGGYNVMYWSSVARAGSHISSVVDSRQVPTDANFNATFGGIAPTRSSIINDSFLAHGFTVGIEFGF